MAGKLFIEMSTVRPEVEVALAAKVRRRARRMSIARSAAPPGPRGKGSSSASSAADADVARARPLLDQMCRRVEHVGPVGSGARMKLAINLPLFVYWQALGEALRCAGRFKIEPERLMSILADTSGAANTLKNRGPNIATWLAGGDFGAVTFELDNVRKDIRTMVAEGQARGVDLPLIERTLVCFNEASQAGYEQSDGSGQAVYWSRRQKK